MNRRLFLRLRQIAGSRIRKDKAYDVEPQGIDLCAFVVTPHVAHNDGETKTDKQHRTMTRTKRRSVARRGFFLNLTAYSLLRIPKRAKA